MPKARYPAGRTRATEVGPSFEERRKALAKAKKKTPPKPKAKKPMPKAPAPKKGPAQKKPAPSKLPEAKKGLTIDEARCYVDGLGWVTVRESNEYFDKQKEIRDVSRD